MNVRCAAGRASILFLLLLPLPAEAQESSLPPILIDAIVTGKTGAVRDLTVKDFELSIDGHDQPIAAAALQSAASLPARPNKHFLILLFDNSTMNAGDQARVRQQVERFIEKAARPDRYMAVLRWFTGMEVVQPFTNDAGTLKKSLQKVAASTVTGSGSQGVLDSGFSSDSTRARATAVQTQNAAPSVGPNIAAGAGVARTQLLMQTLAGLGDALAPIRGRKAVLFFTGGGYSLTTSSDVDGYVEAAMTSFNRANAAIYGISNDSSFSHMLSTRTGGMEQRITGAFSDELTAIADGLDATYLISFNPTGELAQGCHQVRLKVARGLDPHLRREYCAPKLADPLAGTPEGKQLSAYATGPRAGDMEVSLRIPYFYTAADRARGHVVLEVVPAGVKFSKQKNKLVADINVLGVSTRADGSPGPRFSEVLKLAFDKQEQVDAFLKSPFRYESQVEIPAGRYAFQVAVGSGDSFGRAAMPVEVAPWNPSQLTMGALTIGRLRRGGGAGLTAGLDPSLLEGPAPLLAGGARVSPAGSPRFPVGGAGAVYTEIYAPPAMIAKPGVNLQVRYVNRATGAILLDSGEASAAGFARPHEPVIHVAFDLPLKDLPAGQYQVMMRVSSGQAAVIRSADFDVY